eukprot:4785962-Pyramimonas_sp.AAC.1
MPKFGNNRVEQDRTKIGKIVVRTHTFMERMYYAVLPRVGLLLVEGALHQDRVVDACKCPRCSKEKLRKYTITTWCFPTLE